MDFISYNDNLWYLVFFSLWQKNTPEAKMQKLEEIAYERYYKTLGVAKNDLTEYENYKKSSKHLIDKDQNNQIIEAKKRVEDIEEVENMFVRLKERYMHKSKKDRLELHLDFYNFVTNLNRLDSRFEQLNYDLGKDAYETFEEDTKEPRIQNEEIIRRFKEKLKS